MNTCIQPEYTVHAVSTLRFCLARKYYNVFLGFLWKKKLFKRGKHNVALIFPLSGTWLFA